MQPQLAQEETRDGRLGKEEGAAAAEEECEKLTI
jgi:hypothetical protein